ncbi:hypothetical protein [Streptomyces sp. NPDC004267]|uniref:hypothetical protein n=1 Tax=Streptomyces sp. NPDC004267 TaxID=3364694 RepID=UPI0036C0A7B0
MRHELDPAPPSERLLDLLHRAGITHIGPGPRIDPRDLHEGHHLCRASSLGSWAMTSTANSTTTLYRIPRTLV